MEYNSSGCNNNICVSGIVMNTPACAPMSIFFFSSSLGLASSPVQVEKFGPNLKPNCIPLAPEPPFCAIKDGHKIAIIAKTKSNFFMIVNLRLDNAALPNGLILRKIGVDNELI